MTFFSAAADGSRDGTRHSPLLATYVQLRRRQLGLTVARAAHLAGMEISQWYALETGWVPEADCNVLRAIAGTLETGISQLSLLAVISR